MLLRTGNFFLAASNDPTQKLVNDFFRIIGGFLTGAFLFTGEHRQLAPRLTGVE